MALSESGRIPWPSIGTAFQRTSSGRAEASAEGYVHSSTRSVSPGLSNIFATRLHLYTTDRQTVPRAHGQDFMVSAPVRVARVDKCGPVRVCRGIYAFCEFSGEPL